MVDQKVTRSVSFWSTLIQGLAPRPKSEKSIMHWTVVSHVRQTGLAVARPVWQYWPSLAVMAIGMWGWCESAQLAYLF